MKLYTLLLVPALAFAQEKVDMNAMMAKAKRFTQPGESHKLLEKFLGNWTSELRVVMQGAPPAKVEHGDQSCEWLLKGRFVQCKGKSPMMGMPMDFGVIIGYDNFKQSYRVVHLSSMDTALNTSEGDLTRDGKTLLTYGTVDEYLTGEHDKMVKYVWRFDSADQMRFEVHDLPIGETNTQVVAITYKRKRP